MVRKRVVKKYMREGIEPVSTEKKGYRKKLTKSEWLFVIIVGGGMLFSAVAYGFFQFERLSQRKAEERPMYKPRQRPTLPISDIYSYVEGEVEEGQEIPEPAMAGFVPMRVTALLPALMVFGVRDENTSATTEDARKALLEINDVINASSMIPPSQNVSQISLTLNMTKYLFNYTGIGKISDKATAIMESLGFKEVSVYQPGFAELKESDINMTIGNTRETRIIHFDNRQIYTFVIPPSEVGKNITASLRGEISGDKPFLSDKGVATMMAFEQRLIWKVLPMNPQRDI